jgi:hypothetical protein
MKRLLKWGLRLGLLAVALIFLVLLCRDAVTRIVIERWIRSNTGLETRIGKYSSGLFSPDVSIKDLKVYNTPEFGGTPLLEVPEIHVELDREALAQHKLHVTLLRINLAELNIVRNEAGRTNIFSLLNQAPMALATTNGLKTESLIKELGDFQFDGIDILNLSLGRIQYLDLQNARNNREIPVNLQNQIFKKVNSEGDVYGILVMIWLRSGGAFSLAPARTNQP